MISNFITGLRKFTLPYEGGKVNNKKDPGGKTNQGVTQNTFNGYLTRKNRPKRDVYTMTDAERDEIYKYQYWDTVRGDDLPSGVDVAVFDAGVMSGPSRGVKWLQSALAYLGFYKGKVDGNPGVQTLDASRMADSVKTIKRVCANRLGFVRSLTSLFKTFGKGWTARITACEAFCVKLALQAAASAGQPVLPGVPASPAGGAPTSVSGALEQASAEASAEASREGKKSTAATAGGAGAGAGTQAPIGQESGFDPHTIRYLALAVAIVLATAAAVFAWRWYVNKQRAAAYAKEARNA